MQLRSTLAALLAVFLLLISCVGYACETRCDLKAMGGGCHDGSMGSVTIAKAGMQHCGMPQGERTHHTRAGDSLQVSDGCRHSACEQQPMQAAAGDEGSRRAPLPATMEALVPIRALVVSTSGTAMGAASPSSVRVPLPIASRTNLRV